MAQREVTALVLLAMAMGCWSGCSHRSALKYEYFEEQIPFPIRDLALVKCDAHLWCSVASLASYATHSPVLSPDKTDGEVDPISICSALSMKNTLFSPCSSFWGVLHRKRHSVNGIVLVMERSRDCLVFLQGYGNKDGMGTTCCRNVLSRTRPKAHSA